MSDNEIRPLHIRDLEQDATEKPHFDTIPENGDYRISLIRTAADNWHLGSFIINPNKRDKDGRYLIEVTENALLYVRGALGLSDYFLEHQDEANE